MKKIITAALAILAVISLKIYDPSIVEVLRLKAFDQLLTSKEIKTSETAVIIEINESALDRYGQWPWPRDLLADGIRKAKEHGAEIIVLYPLLAEADRSGKDKELKEAIAQAKVIGTQAASLKGKGELSPRGIAIIGSTEEEWFYRYPAGIGSISDISKNSHGMGMTTTVPEIDGVTRKIPLLLMVNNRFYPALPLEIARVIYEGKNYRAKVTESGLSDISVTKEFSVKPDKRGELWIDWGWVWPTIGWLDDWGDLSGKIVVLAVNAEGISNTVATPAGTKLGHEVSLAAWESLWSNEKISRPYWADLAELAYLSIFILLSAFIADRASKIWVGLWGISLLILPFSISYLSFNVYQYLLDWSLATIVVSLYYGVVVYNRFVKEFKLKQQIKKQFGTYLSPAMVEKLQKDPGLLKLGGEDKELSIMFTDVRGFTSISEHYGKDVQGLTTIMNRYMTAMTAKILENEGTLDKYIGDAQMAFWNAPLDDIKHAKNAVKTGLQMLGSLQAFNDEISKEGVPAFGMGLGINTATVVVGNMGSTQRFDYTCLGDGVNLASRLEGQSKPYGVKMVIGPLTAKQVEDEYFVVELDEIAVKGKKEGVKIYTVLGSLKSLVHYAPHRNLHDSMLKRYREQQFELASEMCSKIKKGFHRDMEPYYNMMIERCNEYKTNPPPKNWDGIYRATSK